MPDRENQIKIVWEVEDGYVSGRRPHTIWFDKEEWEALTDDEKSEYVHEVAMQEISISWREG